MKLILLFTLCFCYIMYPQTMESNKQVKQLIEQGRNHIIELAINELKERENSTVKKEDFHFILVKASDKRILVQFGYNVIYLPKNTSYYSDIIVELPSKNVSKSSESNQKSS